MKKIQIAIVALLLTAFLIPLHAKDEGHELWSESTYIQSAKIHYQHVYKKSKLRSDLYHCIDLLKEGAEHFGNMPEFYYMIGTFYAEINSFDTVVAYFDSVAMFCEDETIDKKYRKNCYKKDNYIKKMRNLRQDYWERAYNSAVEYMSQFDVVEDMIANAPTEDSAEVLAPLRQRAFDLSMEEFKMADLAKPGDTITLQGIAVMLQRDDRNLEAIDYYTQVMNIKGEDPDIVSRIAYAYIYIPDWENSIKWFEKLLEYTPDDVNALINLSVAYNNVDNREKWYEYTEKVLALQPDNIQFLFNAGQYWFIHMQDAATAMSEVSGEDAAAEAKRADLETEAKASMEKAAGFFDRIIAQDSTDIDALRQLGILRLLGQDPDGAIHAFKQYIAVKPGDIDILDFLGRAYIIKGDSKAAIEPYEMLVDNDPGNAEAWERLGDLYEYNGMLEKSEAARTTAKELREL